MYFLIRYCFTNSMVLLKCLLAGDEDIVYSRQEMFAVLTGISEYKTSGNMKHLFFKPILYKDYHKVMKVVAPPPSENECLC